MYRYVWKYMKGLLLAIIYFPLVAQTVITENFELYNGSNGEITLSSGIWTFYNAGTAAGNSGNGVKLNSSSSTPGYVVTPVINTLATISFYAKAGSAGKTITIQKSVNGENFSTIASPTLSSSYAQYSVTVNDTCRNIRIKIMNTPGSGTSEYIDDVTFTTLSLASISVSTSSLQNYGNVIAGSSSEVSSYIVSAIHLSSDLVITAPTSFELSIDNISFSNPLTIQPVENSIANKQIYVRFSPTTAHGTIESNIVHSSEGAISRTISVVATAISNEPTTQSDIRIDSVSGNSVKINITQGNGSGRIIIARIDNPVSFVPADAIDPGTVNNNYSAAIDKGDNNKIVYSGNDSTILITGLFPGKTYYFAIYEFNSGSKNSHNYLLISPGTASATTLTIPGFMVNPATISYGTVVVNSISFVKSYVLSGQFLIPESGNITITAPPAFEISVTNNSGFVSELSIPYSNSTIAEQKIYVRFKPVIIQNYSGKIIHVGGNAESIEVSVSGVGVSELVLNDQPIGFASLNGGVTGGKGGRVVTPANVAELKTFMDSNESLIIHITGTMTLSGMTPLRSNKTILGIGPNARIIGGGLELYKRNNIIIRNITFSDGTDDMIKINQNTMNIWVDHCEFSNAPDGLFDITRQSSFITISYCVFYNHSKTMLIGHSDGETADKDFLKTTIHHCWFKGTQQRHPRVRFGKVHTFNNYYDSTSIYGVASACSAYVVVEGNYFKKAPYPIHVGYDASPAGFVNESNNIYENCGTPITNGQTGFKGVPVTNPHTWDPATDYFYILDNAADVPTIVKTNAGVGKINVTAIEDLKTNYPTRFELSQNYPNPFNPTTTIKYQITEKCRVTLKIFDLLGREIATLVNQDQASGIYHALFNASNLPSGVYFYRLTTGSEVTTKRMLLLK